MKEEHTCSQAMRVRMSRERNKGIVMEVGKERRGSMQVIGMWCSGGLSIITRDNKQKNARALFLRNLL